MLEININSFSELSDIKYKYLIFKFSAKWCSSCNKLNLDFKSIDINDCVLINVDYDNYIQDDDFTQYIYIDKLPTIICMNNETQIEEFKYIGTDNEIVKNLILNLNPCISDF